MARRQNGDGGLIAARRERAQRNVRQEANFASGVRRGEGERRGLNEDPARAGEVDTDLGPGSARRHLGQEIKTEGSSRVTAGRQYAGQVGDDLNVLIPPGIEARAGVGQAADGLDESDASQARRPRRRDLKPADEDSGFFALGLIYPRFERMSAGRQRELVGPKRRPGAGHRGLRHGETELFGGIGDGLALAVLDRLQKRKADQLAAAQLWILFRCRGGQRLGV